MSGDIFGSHRKGATPSFKRVEARDLLPILQCQGSPPQRGNIQSEW